MIFYGFALLLAGLSGILALRREPLQPREKALCFFVYFYPFLSGGYFAVSWALASGALLGFLIWDGRRRKAPELRFNPAAASVAALLLCQGLSCFWAVDKGMAVWGVVRFLPLLLYVLVLLQFEEGVREQLWRMLPLSGVVMTVLSGLGQYIPGMEEFFTVEGRLGGFFAYPNTFAAFLLACFVISATSDKRRCRSLVGDAILLLGIFDSGSRTVFVLMAAVILLLCLMDRSRRFLTGTALVGGLCIGAVLVLLLVGGDSSVGRFLSISLESSTLLGRLLYFKDALGVIVTHPLGLGYMGYRALQGTFQTGVYDVTYVHNGLLQLLLDAGWLPALLLGWALLQVFLRKGAGKRSRLLLLVLAGHSMLDFDLEFLSIWFVLLPALELWHGKPRSLGRGGAAALAAAGVMLCASVWLALGDGLFRVGQVDLALQVTPFHTHALEYQLTQIRDVAELDQTADDLLALNRYSSLAHSAKANAAFAKGEVLRMVEEKKLAIASSRYDPEEYCDYFEKVYEIMLLYHQQGDAESAEYCASLLLEIPKMLEQVRQETSPIAWKLDAKPQLALPEAYQQLLAALAS